MAGSHEVRGSIPLGSTIDSTSTRHSSGARFFAEAAGAVAKGARMRGGPFAELLQGAFHDARSRSADADRLEARVRGDRPGRCHV